MPLGVVKLGIGAGEARVCEAFKGKSELVWMSSVIFQTYENTSLKCCIYELVGTRYEVKIRGTE